MRGASILLLAAGVFLLLTGCATEQHCKVVVSVPHAFLLTTPLTHLNSALADLKPGTTTTLEIHFLKDCGILESSNKDIGVKGISVQQGALTFSGGNLSLTYLPPGNCISSRVVGQDNEELLFSNAGIGISFHPDSVLLGFPNVSDFDSTRRFEAVKFCYRSAPLPVAFSAIGGTTSITISLSPDFKGKIGQWYCARFL